MVICKNLLKLVKNCNIYSNSDFSDSEAKEFAKCEMYDLTGMSINSNFDVAFSKRNLDTMTKVTCASTGLPLIDQFEFDRTEGISSIVTDVSFYYNVTVYLKTLMVEKP